MRDLELNGVTFPDGQLCKGTLYAIAGDNLGSHKIGGFTENFSKSTYCSYHMTVVALNLILSSVSSHIFIYVSLDYSLVLGMTFFEGVVSTDLALYIKNPISKEKENIWVMTPTKKPCEVNTEDGHAFQNWCFLAGDSEVWQLILQLREIVELVCAPNISSGQTFRDRVLKPKHHFLNHYPELIAHFEPLICLWTLRFESKHGYFKRCLRKLHNFKNLCGSLAERHQPLQSFQTAGTLFPPSVVVEKEPEFMATMIK
ncbi:hypothetical protein H4Q32_025254 [Labeo rohita]|uniref:Uncharacterized protein n=1 Tax=Labeo rohita TaxID=84645 RepID=A0ABQ8L5A2_LABRO|nr:hypothetical protein H4Q32_025254 [Labeo rohita]